MKQLEVECKFSIMPEHIAGLLSSLAVLSIKNTHYIKKDTYYRKTDSSDISLYKDIRLREVSKEEYDLLAQNNDIGYIFSIPTSDAIKTYNMLTFKQAYRVIGASELFYQEHETMLEDSEVLHIVLQELGAIQYVSKTKIGISCEVDISKNYTIGTILLPACSISNVAHIINCELSLVASLGYFLELELLLDYHTTDNDIVVAETYIIDFAKALNIPLAQKETRLYMDMLRERSNSNNTNNN